MVGRIIAAPLVAVAAAVRTVADGIEWWLGLGKYKPVEEPRPERTFGPRRCEKRQRANFRPRVRRRGW